MALTWKSEIMSLTGTDTNLTTLKNIISSQQVNMCTKMLSWFGIPASSEALCKGQQILWPWEGAVVVALKTLDQAGEEETKRVSLGQAPKHRFILLVWLICCDSIRNTEKGDTGFFRGLHMLIIVHHWQLNNLTHWKISLYFISSTLWNLVFPACSIFAVGPLHFEDTLGEDDSINLANNIHFVFISCFCSFIFWCWIWYMYNTQRVPLFVLIRASHSHFISDRTAQLHCQRSMNQKQFMRGEMFILQMETTGRVGWGGKCKAQCRESRHGYSKQLTWVSQWNPLNLSHFICKMGMGKSCYKKIYDSITEYLHTLNL